MALKFIEGFDHISTTAKLATKGWTTTLAASLPAVTLTFTTGRLERFAAAFSAGNPAAPNSTVNSLVRLLPASTANVIIGFGLKLSRLPTAGTSDVAIIRAGATLTLRISVSTGGLLVLRNSAGTVLATGTTVMSAGNWYYIEVKGFVNGASGTVQAQINGAAEISSTTVNIGSTNFDTLELRAIASDYGASNSWVVTYDDLYVCDTSGSVNNTFLGDVRVSTIFPSADGAHTDFTPDTGTAHFSRVNEASGTYPDDDTSYVSSLTVGHRDSYTFGDLPSATGTVFGIQTNLYARKDDAAVRQIAAVTRPGSTDQDGATVTLSTSYTTYSEIRELNPDTSAAWTISQINASEFGVKVVA